MTYLIGAGPGDPGLLTVKGKEILKKADVVIYDALVNKEILNHCKEDAELIYVGKKISHKELNQPEINELLLSKSLDYDVVVRLKGGDPFIFGRGGEETEFLSKNGINFEVIPGVSSVTAVPAYCGVPLTHREFNSSFAVFTGHLKKFNPNDKTKLNSLAETPVLIFLMGLTNIENIIFNLKAAGKHPETPVLIVSNGTLPEQKSLQGTIDNIVEKLKNNKEITTPAIIIVGEVVKLKDDINWFENKPLFGKRIVITRDINYNHKFSKLLQEYGSTVIEFPSIKISRMENNIELDSAIKSIKKYNYVIFTSVNGVKYFFERLSELGFDSRIFSDKNIITIGEKTSAEIMKYNLKPDLTPFEYVAEGIINLVKDIDIKNKYFLIPRAKVARDVLPAELKKLGAKVDVIPTYETTIPEYSNNELKELLEKLFDDKEILITFTSSSTASNFFHITGNYETDFNKVLYGSIGPITARTVKEHGQVSKIVAKKYTIEGLTREILDYYRTTE